MFATRNLNRHCLKSVSSLLQFNPSKNVFLLRDVSAKLLSSNVVQPSKPSEDCFFSSSTPSNPFDGWCRSMSTSRGSSSRGSSMRSKVAKRMQKESGKTLREVRRAKKLQKKLMTENERLIYNLKRAKRKVALLLQKLKKYELPDLPAPRHDPELLTLEQLQAFKKIGFRNKNYVPVGVRGVFGGVVQNMHLHWKFHETVQVCCDNFPKEKIKEMATMLARLSGGVVINIHNVKTIIMFRGRNYRQPKNLIPFNTLTKRKALFKARFEQALESQKLNIKKIEQELRRSGVNPEDPVAIASIQRVASSFFNAIDQKDGSPYVFRGDKLSAAEPDNKLKHSDPPDEEEEEELDKFIAEIEDAAEFSSSKQPCTLILMVVSSMQHHTHHQQQGPVPPHLQHSRPSSIHQQHHSQSPAQQQQQQSHSSAYSSGHPVYQQQSQANNAQDHSLPYYHPSPYSTPGGTSGYTSADAGEMMAATMPRPPYPPMSYHTPQSNSPASVASPSGHDQQRSMYGQPPSQLHQQSMYYGAPQQQYSSMPAQAAPSPYAQHAQQSHQTMASQPSMMMSHTAPQHQLTQHATQHSQAGMTVSPRPGKIDTHSLNHRIPGAPAPVSIGSASSAGAQNGAPLSTPTSASGVNPNAAPGPIPATTPLVVRQDTNGVQWIAFEYSRDRVKMEYTIRCDVESVNQDELSPEFKTENCVYPRACCPKDQYRGNRLVYETECNSVGWALAQLNPPLRGKRGLIQRAVDSWRNSNQDPRLRSRRVRRMAKMNHRNNTGTGNGQKAGSTTPHGSHIGTPTGQGMSTPTGMGNGNGNNAAIGKPGMNTMGASMHHHHGQPDGSAQGGDEVGMFHQMA